MAVNCMPQLTNPKDDWSHVLDIANCFSSICTVAMGNTQLLTVAESEESREELV